MSQSVLEYFNALDRLIRNTPQVVPKNTKISNDAVSLEAGRQRGSIKRSRPLFLSLITAIDEAAINQNKENVEKNTNDILRGRNHKLTEKCNEFRLKFENSLSSNIKMSVEMLEMKKELVRLRGGQVIPLFGTVEKK